MLLIYPVLISLLLLLGGCSASGSAGENVPGSAGCYLVEVSSLPFPFFFIGLTSKSIYLELLVLNLITMIKRCSTLHFEVLCASRSLLITR